MVTEDMITRLEGACIPAVETPISRRYLRMAQKWFPTALSYFEDWGERPRCGHFFGGVHWYGIETAVPLHALAAVSTSPEYDENTTGLSIDNLREVVIKAIRYLCFTHDTGPGECLRPSTGLGMPRSWGTKWGERGRGFFPESQCGGTIANMTAAALMLRPYVDHETRMMLAEICIDYLERFGEMAPKSGVYADTQMEENAWTAHGLAACYLFLSGHARAEAWEACARRWMFSACAAPQDRFNERVLETGLTAAALTGKTFTTLPDYMAENHGMVHPGYTASGVQSVAALGLLYRMFGRTEPQEAYWNRQRVYDAIKLLTDATGSAMPTQGMDRLYLGEQHVLHASAYLFLKDADAGYFEEVSLALREKKQEGNGGRLIDPVVAATCHEVEDPMEIKESEMIAGIVKPYLLHRLMDGEAPAPTSEAEIATKFNGVRLFPHSGFVHHRHQKGQTSLSWRNYMMALPFTRDGVHTVGPSRWSLLANVTVKDRPGSHNLRVMWVNRKDDGFAALMENDRAQDTIRQRVLCCSLPDGRMVCSERLETLRDCTVEKLDQGFIRVVNENFPLVGGVCDGKRILYHPDGSETFPGFPSNDPDDDVVFDMRDPGWLNVDDQLGIVFQGTGETRYLNRHYFPPFAFRAVADDLFLSLDDTAKAYRAGERVGALALLICPEQSHEETPAQFLTIAESPEDTVCLIVDGYLCAGNFGSKRKVCAFETGVGNPVPVFGSTTRVTGQRVEYAMPIEGGEAVYAREVMKVRTDGDIRIEAVPAGGAYITNEAGRRVEASVLKDRRVRILQIEAEQVVRI